LLASDVWALIPAKKCKTVEYLLEVEASAYMSAHIRNPQVAMGLETARVLFNGTLLSSAGSYLVMLPPYTYIISTFGRDFLLPTTA
jgi:hypothetical protein